MPQTDDKGIFDGIGLIALYLLISLDNRQNIRPLGLALFFSEDADFSYPMI